ncbi:MAG: glycosyl hydrolase family 18 protein [Chloroflexota bacterium]
MEQYPNDPQPRGNNAGCWIISVIAGFVAMVLVIVALFLPPFNLYDTLVGSTYTTIQAEGEAVISDDGGFTLAVAQAVDGEYGVDVDTISLQDFEAGASSAGAWVPVAKNAVPYYLALQSPVYAVDSVGTEPNSVLLSVSSINTAINPDLLDMYGWYGDNATGEWRFIPSTKTDGRLETVTDAIPTHIAVFQVAPDVPDVLVTYDVTTVFTEDAGSVASVVAPSGLQPTRTGTVAGSLAAGYDDNGSYRLMPIIRNFNDPRSLDPETVEIIISNPALRQTHVTELVNITNATGFDGILVDYRGLSNGQRDNFTLFMEELSEGLSATGRTLGVVVPSAENIDGVWQTGAYDWRALGQAVDLFEIRFGINPRLYATGNDQLVEAMLRWGVGEVDRTKIVLGLSALSVREIAGSYNSIGYEEALAGLGNVDVEATNVSETGTIEPGSEIRASLDGRQAVGSTDDTLNAPYLDYVDDEGNTTARIWITTGNALRFRMNWTERFALGGVGFNDLLEDGITNGVLQTIGQYRTQLPTPATMAEWVLRWRIVGADGTVAQTVTTALDENLDITLDAPDGNYAVNPAIVLIEERFEQEAVRGGEQVALFSATATPTPLPTATPTPIPTSTPTPAPIVATATPTPLPPQTNGQNSVPSSAGAVNPGNINLSNFTYGGHVTSANSPRAISAMQSAGMTWMKVQIRYSQGSDPSGAIGAVQAIQGAGFRALIGTVGNPAELAAGGDAYLNNYANWLAAIAAGGADAIEVWNEPNIDREWPQGQISGAAYVNMLSRAYNAIKGANGSTIVISGAPAPTGAEAAFPGQVVNDNNWLGQMVNAGGLQYLDCIGVHYNEGVVPPRATSGDIRDNYYTRYLPTMVSTYRSFAGGKPLCFTELGYVTPEGYPPLPAFFSWGQNTSVQEQATWLADAASYLSQQGDVRMMIVWNIDFTLYAADPQGGYAIIRPDGGCPACSALSSAR